MPPALNCFGLNHSVRLTSFAPLPKDANLTLIHATGTAGFGHLEYRFRQIKKKLGLNNDEDIERILLADAAAISAETSQRPEQRSSTPVETPSTKRFSCAQQPDNVRFDQGETPRSRNVSPPYTPGNYFPTVSAAKRRAFQSEPHIMEFVERQCETSEMVDEQCWITLRLPTHRAFLRHLLLPGQASSAKKLKSVTGEPKEDEGRARLSETMRMAWARRLANGASPLEMERRRRNSEAMKAAHARRLSKNSLLQSPNEKSSLVTSSSQKNPYRHIKTD